MPIPPSAYAAGPLTPGQLNSDLYSFDGTAVGANGINFHARRPLLWESLTSPGSYPVTTGGSWSAISNSTAFNIIDTAALNGLGLDYPAASSQYQCVNHVSASAGAAGSYGGWWLAWNFPAIAGIANASAAAGAGMFLSGSLYSTGILQRANSNHDSCAWYLDLLPLGGTTQTWQPAVWIQAASGSSSPLFANTQDTSGENSRMGFLWTAVSVTGAATAPAVPAPQASWGTVTPAALNTSIGAALTFLNNPPVLRQAQTTTTSVPNTSLTQVALPGTPQADNYGGWDSPSSSWTAPLPGLYIVSPLVTFNSSGSNNTVRRSYVGVSGYGQIQGPSQEATPSNSSSAGQIQVLDLRAGDAVSVYAWQASGSSLSLSSSLASRLVVAYMGPPPAAGPSLTWTVPGTTFRWQAGMASGAALLGLLNTHLGNDLSFLVNRPVFTGYQASAQSGFGNNSGFHQVTIDTPGGIVYGGAADNYGGWNAANGWYAAQVPGWYLVVSQVFATAPAVSATGYVTAGIFCSSSGGLAPLDTPDWYQHMNFGLASAADPPGACAVGVYYLQPGEYVYPVVQAQDWGGTWGTVVRTASNGIIHSQFSVFWVSA